MRATDRTAPPPSPRPLRWLTALTTLSVWGLVAVGGIVRVTGSGLGCPDWPLCTPQALPLANTESVIEYSHRIVVAWVTVLVIVVAVVAWRTQRGRADVLWPATIAVALLPLQAVLGAIAIERELAGAMVAYHFLLGMLFLAANAATAAAVWRPIRPRVDDGDGSSAHRGAGEPTVGFVYLARAGAVVGLLTVSLGAAVVAGGAAMACGEDWPLCNGGFATGGGFAALQVTHRMFAYGLTLLAVWLAALALAGRGPRLIGTVPAIAALVQVGLGVGVVSAGTDFDLYAIFSGAHVAGAGLVWGLLVTLAFLVRSPEGAEPIPPAEPLPDVAPAEAATPTASFELVPGAAERSGPPPASRIDGAAGSGAPQELSQAATPNPAG